MVRHVHVAKDGTEFVFREPCASDARAFMRFINSFVDDPMSGILVNKKVTLKDEESWLENVLRETRARRMVMLAAEREGAILGNCDIRRMPYKHAHRAVLGVALTKNVRGIGVGEALMRSTIALAVGRMSGVEALDLATFGYNDRAVSLYKKMGFREVGRVPRSVKEGDEYYDEILMRLDLTPVGRP